MLGVRVRIGVHTGPPKVRARTYWGIDVHYAARLAAAANGGQVLVSESTAALVSADLEDLGEHALKDFPGPRRVFHLLIDGRGSVEFARPRTLRPGRTNLPDQLSTFIGRERDLERVSALLEGARIVTLVGAGGVGKTRLALAVAARLLDGSGDGVWLVELAGSRAPELVILEVARVLDVSEQPPRPVLDSLVEAVGDRNLLLVLDNCEHLVGAVAELVVGLLTRCPRVAVLATSREPLDTAGERVYRVSPLSLPAGVDFQSLGESEATRLFLERANELRPFAVDENNAEDVAAVVRRIDGIPLAIELAAARLRSLGIGQLRARLDQSFGLLTGGRRTAVLRQQTLGALLDWSYDLLSEREQILLERLSVFAGGFELEAAEAVCTDDDTDEVALIDLLGALVDKSLVQVDDIGERLRYRLLGTVGEYAAAKLSGGRRERREGVRRAHRDYYLALAESSEPFLDGPDQLSWLDRLELEHNNFRAALSYCLEDPAPHPGLRLAVALTPFRRLRNYGIEGAAALLAHLDRPEACEPTLLRARALIAAGQSLTNDVGDPPRGETFCKRALTIARDHRDAHVTAEALAALGYARFRQGGFADALALFEEGVALARVVGEPRLLATLLGGYSSALRNAGRDSRESLEEAVRLHRESGDRIGLAFDLQQLGIDALGSGNAEAARVHFEEARCLGRRLKMQKFEWSTGINLGLAAYVAGDNIAARACFHEVLTLARDHWKLVLPHAVFGLALTTSDSDPDGAAILHGAAEALLQETGFALEGLEIQIRDEDYARLQRLLGRPRFLEAIEAGRARQPDTVITELTAT